MSTPPHDPSQQPPGDSGGSWGYPPPGHEHGGYGGPPADHPRATMTLVLGILGLVCCGLLAPVAWVMGKGVVNDIDAAPQRFSGRGVANAGRICGIIGTLLLILGIVLLVLLLAVGGMTTVSFEREMSGLE